jgi:starch synthase
MPMRVLYVAGEVAPFSKATNAAQLMRDLPERLHESGGVEARIMMPRYGTVSERRNRLHEVIRLSGAEITIGERTETLKVKVASIPGIRLQVYFMDNAHYFKRKGLFSDRKTEQLFEDNADRALFFGRAALATAEGLGWSPEIVHASGWIAGLVPMLLKTELAEHPLFAQTKAVYTPDSADVDVRFSAERAATLNLPEDAGDRELREIGLAYADATAFGSGRHVEGGTDLTGEEGAERAAALYRQLLGVEASPEGIAA